MLKKVSILLFLGCLVALYIKYEIEQPRANNKNKSDSRDRIKWVDKNSPFNKKNKRLPTAKSKSYYFTFPELDKLVSSSEKEAFFKTYTLECLSIYPKIDEKYYKDLKNDINIATMLLKDIEVTKDHKNLIANFEKNSQIKEIQTVSENTEYLLHIKDLYWLQITKLRGLWRHRKVSRESSFLSIEHKRSFWEISYASKETLKKVNKEQTKPGEGFYHLLNNLREKNEILEDSPLEKQLQGYPKLLSDIANLSISVVQLYIQSDNFMLKQQIGFYHKNISYEWNIARRFCAEAYCQQAQKSKQIVDNLEIAAKIYPKVDNLERVAFVYAEHNMLDQATQWIQKIKTINSAHGEYCFAKFYATRDKEKSLKHLEQAFKEGFSEFSIIVSPDGGFESLHQDNNYRKVLDKYIHNY